MFWGIMQKKELIDNRENGIINNNEACSLEKSMAEMREL